MPIINQIVKGGGGTAPAYYIEKSIDSNNKLVNGSSIININGATDIGDYVLQYAYEGNTNISGVVDFSSLTQITGNHACFTTFHNCTGITGVNLSNVTQIIGNMCCSSTFNGCTNLVNIDVSKTQTISGQNCATNMFRDCTSITSITFTALETISGGQAVTLMFYNATNLANVYFPVLRTISSTTVFGNFVGGVTGCTIHLPSNFGTTLTASDFGGTNTMVLYDLPAASTLTGADSNTYTRNPKYDTATALAWKVGAYGTANFTPAYYTSGTTDPVVNDTIYSDAACTIAVTTIDTIA